MPSRLNRALSLAALIAAAGLGAGCASSNDADMAYQPSRSANGVKSTQTRVVVQSSMSGVHHVRRDPHAVVTYAPGTMPTSGMSRLDPVTGEPYRLYFYYPNNEVYLDVRRSMYFWREGHAWRSGHELPSSISSSMSWSDVERIGLSTEHPYELHEAVTAMHPSLTTLRRQARAIRRTEGDGAYASVPTDH